MAFFDAILSLAQHIAASKSNKPKDVSLEFLRSITPEHLLTLGMLADAGYEEMMLLRQFDAAVVSPTEVTQWLSDYERCLSVLFEDEKAVLSGYTAWVLRLQSTPSFHSVELGR